MDIMCNVLDGKGTKVVELQVCCMPGIIQTVGYIKSFFTKKLSCTLLLVRSEAVLSLRRLNESICSLIANGVPKTDSTNPMRYR